FSVAVPPWLLARRFRPPEDAVFGAPFAARGGGAPRGPPAVDESDDWNRRLLRARRERPRRRRAAKHCNELAPLHLRGHSMTSSARASSGSGTSIPRARAVLRLIASSYFTGACTGRSAGFSPFRTRST